MDAYYQNKLVGESYKAYFTARDDEITSELSRKRENWIYLYRNRQDIEKSIELLNEFKRLNDRSGSQLEEQAIELNSLYKREKELLGTVSNLQQQLRQLEEEFYFLRRDKRRYDCSEERVESILNHSTNELSKSIERSRYVVGPESPILTRSAARSPNRKNLLLNFDYSGFIRSNFSENDKNAYKEEVNNEWENNENQNNENQNIESEDKEEKEEERKDEGNAEEDIDNQEGNEQTDKRDQYEENREKLRDTEKDESLTKPERVGDLLIRMMQDKGAKERLEAYYGDDLFSRLSDGTIETGRLADLEMLLGRPERVHTSGSMESSDGFRKYKNSGYASSLRGQIAQKSFNNYTSNYGRSFEDLAGTYGNWRYKIKNSYLNY